MCLLSRNRLETASNAPFDVIGVAVPNRRSCAAMRSVEVVGGRRRRSSGISLESPARYTARMRARATSLEQFGPAVADWFRSRFAAPTDVQQRAWPAIRGGTHTLIAAPTGSGKTLAAFMAALDNLVRAGL